MLLHWELRNTAYFLIDIMRQLKAEKRLKKRIVSEIMKSLALLWSANVTYILLYLKCSKSMTQTALRNKL